MFSQAGAGVQSKCLLCAIALAEYICGVEAGMSWFIALLDKSCAFPTWEAL